MKKTAWKNRIKKACEEAGTYRPYFDSVIETLATILQERDSTYQIYVARGAKPCKEYTNKIGAKNTVKNPLLVTWEDLNAQALAYWRDLGLTPAGLKKLNSFESKKTGATTVNDILNEIGF